MPSEYLAIFIDYGNDSHGAVECNPNVLGDQVELLVASAIKQPAFSDRQEAGGGSGVGHISRMRS